MAEASQLKFAGAALLLIGVVIAALIALHPEGLKVPASVAYLCAGIFVLGSVTAFVRGYGRPRLADAAVCLLLGSMLAVIAWLSLGPGPRQCASSASGSAVSEFACRSAFGLGALVLAGMLLVAVRGLRQRGSAG